MTRSRTSTTTRVPRTSIVALAAALLFSGAAHAQDQNREVRGTYGQGYYGWTPSGAATWQESVLHGYSDLLRSAGQRELLHYQGELLHYEALQSREEAIEQSLENSVHRLEVRQTRQMMGLQHRETLRRMEREQHAAATLDMAAAEPIDEAAEAERRAANKLHLARGLLDAGRSAAGERYLEDILRDYAGTAAAGEAEQLLAER